MGFRLGFIFFFLGLEFFFNFELLESEFLERLIEFFL